MKKWCFLFFLYSALSVTAQQPADTLAASHHPSRKWIVGGASFAGYAGSIIAFSQAWYKNYPRSSFHTFNDIGEWQQMDKLGHSWAGYNTSRLTTDMWQWAGASHDASVFLGAGSSLLYMLSIEYLDGRSAEWGWSWPDAGADIAGAGLFAVQELGWREQRIQLKFSAHYKHYPDPVLRKRADDLFGSTFQERLLKDYNAQTYWLSFNLRSFFPRSGLPRWLNVSFGYGAGNMFGGYQNIAHDNSGTTTFDRRDLQRYRQWYLAPDIDLTKIRTRSRFLRTVFSAVNVLKIPAPALELSRGKLRVKGLAF